LTVKGGRPGVTSRDIARETGVSTATVSYVLSGRADARVSEKTRERVLAAAERLGYRRNALARALRTGRTYTLGVVCPLGSTRALGASRFIYAKDLLLAVSAAAARAGMSTTPLIRTREDPLLPEHLADGRFEGMILFGVYQADDWVRSVYATGLPCVEIGMVSGLHQVHADHRGGVRSAVEHLRGLGHRRICYWRGPEEVPAARERAAGFLEGARDAGLPPDWAPVVTTAEETAALLARADRPTALVLYNDERAPQALDLIHAAGLRVPEDLSLVGFDNDVRATTVRPQLTTVQNPLDAMADAAIGLLQAQIAGVEVPVSLPPVPTRLVVRESTAPAAAGPGGTTEQRSPVE
jgi:LacI family transcriptional regulator